jgi:hypothetical protein
MVLMAVPPGGGCDSFADGQYGLPQHKPKGRVRVNTPCLLLQCGISLGKAVDWPDLPIEELAGLG